MNSDLANIIDLHAHPMNREGFRAQCKSALDDAGVLVLKDFLHKGVVEKIKQEGLDNQHLAYFTANTHNIYLKPADPELPAEHPRNRPIQSSKGCITTDQIPAESALHTLYEAESFKQFLGAVLGEQQLHEYADPLSSINLHYASAGQELGWHFDNSSFAITLLIDKPEQGGGFEYVKDVRNADAGELNYDLAGEVLDGAVATTELSMNPGDLVLFRGRNSMHRVTPTIGDCTRILVVLAYNTEPGISLSESARMTFFGRLG